MDGLVRDSPDPIRLLRCNKNLYIYVEEKLLL